MTLEEMRAATGWSKHELARQSGIDINTLNRALIGKPISINTANRLAIGLSKGLKRTIKAKDIEGLNVK